VTIKYPRNEFFPILQLTHNTHRDDFVYEYVGDVVNEAALRKRMREYAEEGIQHFYFMMLQREQVAPFL
jgi:hypothetical protein